MFFQEINHVFRKLTSNFGEIHHHRRRRYTPERWSSVLVMMISKSVPTATVLTLDEFIAIS